MHSGAEAAQGPGKIERGDEELDDEGKRMKKEEEDEDEDEEVENLGNHLYSYCPTNKYLYVYDTAKLKNKSARKRGAHRESRDLSTWQKTLKHSETKISASISALLRNKARDNPKRRLEKLIEIKRWMDRTIIDASRKIVDENYADWTGSESYKTLSIIEDSL
eukprot:jgi/Bigna1/128722/aug1.7_g3430